MLALPLAWGARLAVVAAAVVGIDARLRAMRRSVPALIHLGLDRRIAITGGDGHTREGTVLPATYVGARVVSVVWRPDGWSRWRPAPALLLLPDMLAGDEHRQLRVALRYGRAPPVGGRAEPGAAAECRGRRGCSWRRGPARSVRGAGDQRRGRRLTGKPRATVDPHAARGVRATTEQRQVQRHQVGDRAQRRLVLARMRQRPQRRANRARHDGAGAQVRPVLPFVGQRRRQRRQRGLRGAVRAPVRARRQRVIVEGEDDGGIGRGGEQRHGGARQGGGGGDIDAQHLLPHVEGLVLDRAERAQVNRGVHDAVQPVQLRLDCAQRVGVVGGLGHGEVERQDRRFGVAGRDDLVVQRFELAHDPAVQHDRRAGGGAGARERRAEAAGGSGDQDHAAGEVDRGGFGQGGHGVDRNVERGRRGTVWRRRRTRRRR